MRSALQLRHRPGVTYTTKEEQNDKLIDTCDSQHFLVGLHVSRASLSRVVCAGERKKV